MSRKEYHVVGLDVGSHKTCALVCQPGDDGKLQPCGVGTAESKGWRKGLIVNLDACVLAIKKAVEAAEAAAGISIDSAYVGIGGAHIKGVNSRGGLNLGKSQGGTREVTREDVSKVIQTAQSMTLPPDRERFYVEQQEYFLDSQNGIHNPVGMVGSRLEVNVHLITASATAYQNIVTAVNLAGIKVPDSGIVFEPLAGALACLTPDERELGVALVDIGGGSTDLIVYHQRTVRHTAVIPVGGDHFTNDIAVGLRTPIPEAEKMKCAWGERDSSKSSDNMLEVPSVGERPTRDVNYTMLSDILVPRATEMLELIRDEIEHSGFANQLGAGIVLVGGGAKLGGLVSLAEQTFELPVRVGEPKGLGKMTDALSDPASATVVGLIAYGNWMRLRRESQEKSWTGKLWGAFRGKGATS
ncbi:MAG TPA: cell division protein FtsA [Terriglobia bacterium]|nr:cell division protein FtsA [Terriglobia bacterium]